MSSTDTTTVPAVAAAHPVPLASSIPKVLTRSFLVLNVETDAWVQIFADRIFVGVSQLDRKVGTYLLCEAETNEINPRQVEYRLSTLLGNREDAMLGVYARTLTERIRAFHASESENHRGDGSALPKEVLLGVSLDKDKGRDPKMFQLLISILVDMYVDAVRDTTAA